MASTSVDVVDIQGHILEVTVVGGTNLKNTAIVGKQDPYVELVYGDTKHQTKPCKASGTNPAFHDKVNIKLVQGIRQIKVSVYNQNTLREDAFIGEGKVYLNEVLRRGAQDIICHLNNNSRSAGDIRIIMMYPHVLDSATHLVDRTINSDLEVTNLEKALAEKDEEVIRLRRELSMVGKQKKVEYEDMISESTLNKLKAELAAKDAELTRLTRKGQDEAATASYKLEYSELKYIKTQNELDALKRNIEGGTVDASVFQLANAHLQGILTAKEIELGDMEIKLKESATKEKNATILAETLDLALKQVRGQMKFKDAELSALKEQATAGDHASQLKKMNRNLTYHVHEDRNAELQLRALQLEYDNFRKAAERYRESASEEQRKLKVRLIEVMLDMRKQLDNFQSNINVSEEQKAQMKQMIWELEYLSGTKEEMRSSSYCWSSNGGFSY